MSARPHFLRGFMPRDFASTSGHTEPAAATLPGVYVLSEDGARLDLHRVTPAQAWLSDLELAGLDGSATAKEIEATRRAAVRERCQQVREEMRVSRKEWGLWAAALAVGVIGSYFFPSDWGYGLDLGMFTDWFW